MDKRVLLDRFGEDAELRVTLSRVLDKAENARRKQMAQCTAFLSPREGMIARQMLGAPANLMCFGGYEGAERQVMLFLPDWMEPEFVEQGEYLSFLRCTWFKEDKLTHRDILGALMGIGVRRDTVGDILVGEGSCDLIVLPGVAGFLKDSFSGAGRVRFRVEELEQYALRLPKQERKVLRDTVATLRLDSVLSVGFSISRTKAAELIASGRCAVNWQETTKSDLVVKAGDVISCRGLGKCRLTEVGGLSCKGRINITVERYL